METPTKDLCVLTDYSAVIVVAADAFPARVLSEITRESFQEISVLACSPENAGALIASLKSPRVYNVLESL